MIHLPIVIKKAPQQTPGILIYIIKKGNAQFGEAEEKKGQCYIII